MKNNFETLVLANEISSDEFAFVTRNYAREIYDTLNTYEIQIGFFSEVESFVDEIKSIDRSVLSYNSDKVTSAFNVKVFQDYSLSSDVIISDFNICILKIKEKEYKFIKLVTPFTRERTYDFIIIRQDETEEILHELNRRRNKDNFKKEEDIPIIGLDFEELEKNTIRFLMNEEFREYCKSKHIKFKRGVVLEGIPGTGKSLSIKHIRKLAEENDISFHVFDGVKEFMEEANRLYSREEKKIFVFEDFDAFLRDRNDTNDAPNQILGKVLNTLDGVDKVDNVVSIFTTNKIDLFDTAFIRPGRIDKVFTYVLPDISDVKKFIYAYLSEDNANIVYPIVKEHKEHAMINLTYAILKGLCDEINIFLFEKITESDKEIIIEKADAQRIIDEKIRAANKNEKTGSKSDYTL